MELPQPLAAVYFDCDSTLATVEGIDELANTASDEVRARITNLTDRAMDGELSVETVYAERLDVLRPNATAVEAIGARYCATLIPDAADVVLALRSLGKRVGIISGGLKPAVMPLATKLGIASKDVHAVDLYFDNHGRYAGFESTSPMTRNGGKPELLAHLLATDPTLRPVAFVGDGITDLETTSVVDRFIGFGGVVRRDKVVAAAQHFADGPSLASILPFCSTAAERRHLREDRRFSYLLLPTETPS